MYNNIIVSTLYKISKILPSQFKMRSVYLAIGILINSLLEIIGLAAILPVLAAILKKGFIHDNYFTERLYTFFGFQDDRTFIVGLCILIFTLVLLKNLFGVWIQKKQAIFSWDLHEKLSSLVFYRAYHRGFLFFTQNNSNKILNRVNAVPQQFAQLMLVNIFQFLNEFIILVFILVSLMVYDYKILLLLIGIVLPVFLLFYQANKKKVTTYGIDLNELAPKISKPVFDVVFGYVDVVVNGVFNNFSQKYLSKIKQAKSIRVSMLIIQNIPNRLIEVSVILAVLIMLLYGLFYLKEIDKILTLMSVFGLAAYRTIPSINRLMLSLVNIKNQQFTLDVLEKYLKKPFCEVSSEEVQFEKSISIENLEFTYPDSGKPTLSNLTFEIKKGESIGIIGRSGSGKTTFMNILLGFLRPTGGTMSVDGEVLNESNIVAWQKKCGYVRQDVFVIDGSLIENVAFGIDEPEVDLKKFNEAIHRSQLTELIENLPDGKDTQIGERGAKISGGQRQRIGIARALYHGAEILFFDEATSALDSETEEEITEAIRSLHESHLTMVIIAHRESTLKYCDKKINLKNEVTFK